MELGAQDYVMKPFTSDILIGKLEANTGKKVA
jgi:DNA-binding response OmpR family regulator